MKPFILGIISISIISIVSFALGDSNLFMMSSSILGFGSLILGGITSGVMSGNMYRRTAMESNNERRNRLITSTTFFMFALPNIIILILYLFIYN